MSTKTPPTLLIDGVQFEYKEDSFVSIPSGLISIGLATDQEDRVSWNMYVMRELVEMHHQLGDLEIYAALTKLEDRLNEESDKVSTNLDEIRKLLGKGTKS